MYRILSLLLIVVAVVSACKTESPKQPSTGSSAKPSDVNVFSFSGRVYPVLASGGVVTVHPITEDGWSSNNSISSAVIDADGRFDIDAAKHYLGAPVVLRISVDEGGMLRCVQTTQCPGRVAFGELFEVDSNGWELFLAIPELLPDQIYSVTPFSHIAFKAIEERLADIQIDDKNSLHVVRAKNLISSMNTRVASRFGLVADLPTLGYVDVTDASEITQSSSPVIRDSFVGGSILQGAADVYSDRPMVIALNMLAKQYAEKGIPGMANESNVVSQALILSVASHTVDELQKIKGWNLSQTASEIQAELDFVSLEEPNRYSRGTESPSHLLTGLEKGFQLVSDVRRVANSVDLRKIAALGSFTQIIDGGASDLLQQFGMDFGESTTLSGDDFLRIQTALKLAGEAVLAATLDYYAKGVTSNSYEDLLFNHSYLSDTHFFTFTSPVDACDDSSSCPVDLNLGIGIKIDRFMGNAGVGAIAARSIEIDLAGFVRSGSLELFFREQGQQFEFRRPIIEMTNDTDGMWNIERFLFEGESVAIQMPVELRKRELNSSESSRVLFRFSAGKHLINYSQRDSLNVAADGSVTRIAEDVVGLSHLESFRFGLASSVKNGENESFLGVLNLHQAPSNSPKNILFKTSLVSHCGTSTEESACEEVSSDSVIEGETSDNYLVLNASAGFRANLKGISDPVILELSGSRDSPTTNSINKLKVSYPGHSTRLNGTFNNNGGISALSAVNLDGMQLDLETKNGKRSGLIQTPSGEKVADLIDMGQWVKIQYINGDFESL